MVTKSVSVKGHTKSSGRVKTYKKRTKTGKVVTVRSHKRVATKVTSHTRVPKGTLNPRKTNDPS